MGTDDGRCIEKTENLVNQVASDKEQNETAQAETNQHTLQGEGCAVDDAVQMVSVAMCVPWERLCRYQDKKRKEVTPQKAVGAGKRSTPSGGTHCAKSMR